MEHLASSSIIDVGLAIFVKAGSSFSPVRDIILTLILLAGFLLYYRNWIPSGSLESGVDLKPRLQQACVRTSLFFMSVLAVCWFSNVSVFLPIAILFVLGIVVSIGSTMTEGYGLGGGFVFGAAAMILREWSFGFPNLILSPRERKAKPRKPHEMAGSIGVTTSDLRPAGYVRMNDKEVPAVSANGKQIDSGTEIVVTDFKNGKVHVRIPNNERSSADHPGIID